MKQKKEVLYTLKIRPISKFRIQMLVTTLRVTKEVPFLQLHLTPLNRQYPIQQSVTITALDVFS